MIASTMARSAPRHGSHGILLEQIEHARRARPTGRCGLTGLVDRRHARRDGLRRRARDLAGVDALQQICRPVQSRVKGNGRIRRAPGRITRRIAVELGPAGPGSSRAAVRQPWLRRQHAAGDRRGQREHPLRVGGYRHQVAIVQRDDAAVAKCSRRIFWFALSTSPICCHA